MKEKKLIPAILLLFSMLLIINLIRLNQDYDFIYAYSENNEKINNFHSSGFWNLTSLFIDGLASGPGAHNWTWVISQEWFGGGNGSWSSPYRIENITTRSISILRSNKYFTLRNCTVFNSTYFAIYFSNVSNGKIIENKCSFNVCGFFLYECSNNTISDNIINSSKSYGLQIYNSFNNTILNNHLNKCGISILSSSIQKESNIIDSSNLINGKPLYFYFDEKNLGHDNFTNAGQVILHNCNDSLISDLNFNQCSNGISLVNCHNNRIENNIFTNNSCCGIEIILSVNNVIENNIFTNNSWYAIEIVSSINNVIENNILTNNYFFGIGISSSSDNTIKENVLNNNLIGIGIGLKFGIDSSNNQIYANNILNGIYGVFIYGGEKNNISKNFIVNNTKNGIYLEKSDSNDITENNIINNEYGINLNGSSNNRIGSNEVYNNTFGIYLDQLYFDLYGIPLDRTCESNTIFSNQINFNKVNGISIREGQWNNISSNNINYNNKNGILLENSHLNYLIENIINFNYCGINLTTSNFNQVIGNSLYKNNICIYEDDSCKDNFFEDNNCFDEENGQWIFFLIIGCVLSIAGLVLIIFIIYFRKKSK